ncbi:MULTISPECIES: hypothetical protein [unclassified Streptosporangium]|uniref:hypothetical protein n=1 Tax=unclassified Streptosporangium TaxID=2632669 RepID=UPI002E2DFB97|nr:MULTISPECIES: hypothetical protein [unclassified Streptosporangium]
MRVFRVGLAVALLTAVCGCAATGRGERPQAAESTTVATPSPKEAQKPADSRTLYLESLRQQALQPSVNLVQEYYWQKKFYPGGSRSVVVSGVDYRTKDVRLENSQVTVAGGRTWTAWATWCRGKSEEWFWTGEGDWEMKSSTRCPSLPSQVWLNDGLGVGGLTKEQADVFVGQLDSYQGLISGRGMSVVKRNGKPYMRLEISVKPQRFGSGRPVGAGMYLDAFKYVELDALIHPYGLLPSVRSAMDIVRYIDPETRLPVYSEMLETDKDTGRWRMHRVVYEFGGPVGESAPLPATPGITRLTWRPERT